MADPNENDNEETTPPPTQEERQVETVNDPTPEPESEPDPAQPDVSARLDALEREMAALKAMMDTLGYNDAAAHDNDDTDHDGVADSIENLFD